MCYSSAASPVFVHFLFAWCCFSFFQFLYLLVLLGLWNLKFWTEFCLSYTENMFLLTVFTSLLHFPPWLPWLVAWTVTTGFENKRGDIWRKYVFERGKPFSFPCVSGHMFTGALPNQTLPTILLQNIREGRSKPYMRSQVYCWRACTCKRWSFGLLIKSAKAGFCLFAGGSVLKSMDSI